MASFFFIGTAVSWGTPWLAGLCAALAFGSKWTVGLLAAAAALFAGIWNRRPAKWHATFMGLFLCGVSAIIAAIAASGGMERFVDYVFLNKTKYVRINLLAFRQELERAPEQASPSGKSSALIWGPLRRATVLTFYFFPLMLIALSWKLWRSADPGRRRAWIFVLASTGMLFPMWWKFIWAAPVMLVGSILAARKPSWTVTFAIAICLLIAPTQTHWFNRSVRSGPWQALGLPHYRGILVTPEERDQLTSEVTRVRAASSQYYPLFLAFDGAGFYLSAGDIPPVSLYEIPSPTSFGRHGEEETMRKFRRVCFSEHLRLTNLPYPYRDFVISKFHAGQDLGPCRLYSADP